MRLKKNNFFIELSSNVKVLLKTNHLNRTKKRWCFYCFFKTFNQLAEGISKYLNEKSIERKSKNE